VRSLSDARKKAIKARLNTYDLDAFKTMFEKAEASDFLKGSNERNWTATFDWLLKDSNMAKVLDGNYDNKGRSGRGRKEIVPGWANKREDYDVNAREDMERMKRMLNAGNSPEIAERAENLKKRLGG